MALSALRDPPTGGVSLLGLPSLVDELRHLPPLPRSVAAKVGFCGLDRRREPLRGDEVRACWEDGATPTLPEPSIPGLLDLLTEPAPPIRPEPVELQPRSPARPWTRRAARLRSITPHGAAGWVEVEA